MANLGTIPAGAGATVTITVLVTPAASGSLGNTATVTTSTPDSNPDNNADTEIVVGGTPIPTLSFPMLALLAAALAALGALVLRRTPLS
jgi:hypothetical protein